MDMGRECWETSSHGEEVINMCVEKDEKLKWIEVRNG